MSQFILVPLFAALDRLFGWKVNGVFKRAAILAATVAPACYFGLHLSPLASGLMAAAFLLDRDPKWTIFTGDSHPYPSQIEGTFARHLLSLGFLAPLLVAGAPVLPSIGLLVLYAAIATALGRLNRIEADKGDDINAWVEAARGAARGAAVGVALSLA